ncbi:MAG TPA: GMC family oxidoreductase N-terminal domain-containing protein [Pseudonocardiaceae bacterium]|nr:GMC family oxidoreductase N-terminal domain-containing protein [Pseudonocardiaceae bacterium]
MGTARRWWPGMRRVWRSWRARSVSPSAAVAYLRPAMSRPNLHVETHVQVVKVLFEGTRAVGVQGVRLGEQLTFRAASEIIISCGAYNSPSC